MIPSDHLPLLKYEDILAAWRERSGGADVDKCSGRPEG